MKCNTSTEDYSHPNADVNVEQRKMLRSRSFIVFDGLLRNEIHSHLALEASFMQGRKVNEFWKVMGYAEFLRERYKNLNGLIKLFGSEVIRSQLKSTSKKLERMLVDYVEENKKVHIDEFKTSTFY